jgi:hypothetical protein
MATLPRTVSEAFPSEWLRAADLVKPCMVKIAAVTFEELRMPDGKMRTAACVAFERAQKRLVLNVTQARAIAAIVGSEAFADWPGHMVRLSAGMAPNGKATVTVGPAEPPPLPPKASG